MNIRDLFSCTESPLMTSGIMEGKQYCIKKLGALSHH